MDKCEENYYHHKNRWRESSEYRGSLTSTKHVAPSPSEAIDLARPCKTCMKGKNRSGALYLSYSISEEELTLRRVDDQLWRDVKYCWKPVASYDQLHMSMVDSLHQELPAADELLHCWYLRSWDLQLHHLPRLVRYHLCYYHHQPEITLTTVRLPEKNCFYSVHTEWSSHSSSRPEHLIKTNRKTVSQLKAGSMQI